MYLADYEATNVEFGRPLQTWDDLTAMEQSTYLRHVEASFKYLFEHGRISGWVSHKSLEEYSTEYKAYLAAKQQEKQQCLGKRQ